MIQRAECRFDVLVIVGPQEEKESFIREGIVLANDEDSYTNPSRKIIPRFLTHSLRVRDAGSDPGYAFYRQAEKQWGRIANKLGIPWNTILRINNVDSGYERVRTIYLLRIDEQVVGRIVREAKEHDLVVVSRNYFLNNVRRYHSWTRPETHPESHLNPRGHSYMHYSEFALLENVCKKAWC